MRWRVYEKKGTQEGIAFAKIIISAYIFWNLKQQKHIPWIDDVFEIVYIYFLSEITNNKEMSSRHGPSIGWGQFAKHNIA